MQSGSKVFNSNSYINLKIWMTTCVCVCVLTSTSEGFPPGQLHIICSPWFTSASLEGKIRGILWEHNIGRNVYFWELHHKWHLSACLHTHPLDTFLEGHNSHLSLLVLRLQRVLYLGDVVGVALRNRLASSITTYVRLSQSWTIIGQDWTTSTRNIWGYCN